MSRASAPSPHFLPPMHVAPIPITCSNFNSMGHSCYCPQQQLSAFADHCSFCDSATAGWFLYIVHFFNFLIPASEAFNPCQLYSILTLRQRPIVSWTLKFCFKIFLSRFLISTTFSAVCYRPTFSFCCIYNKDIYCFACHRPSKW